jgi:hypothetical protein
MSQPDTTIDSQAAPPEPPSPPKRPVSERARAARRANAKKSTGPRTARGKQIASQNARRSVRLLGLAEARALNQDLDAAERLYRELIAPYQPCPVMLARHFQDLARLYLEIEAWERIRDAQLERRWEQVSIAHRRRYHEMARELRGKLKDVFETGLQHMEDSPAKFKQAVDCLSALRDQLAGRDFDLKPVLRNLYGNALDPEYSRAQTICMRCERLMDPKDNPLDKEEFEGLRDLVELEFHEAREAYTLSLDERTMTRAECLASLAPTQQDIWMDRQGERLRRAIDRKQWVITGLLQTLGLSHRAQPDAPADGTRADPPPPLSNSGKTKLGSPLESIKSSKNEAKTKLKTAQIHGDGHP